jgi:hypothetical protein
MKLTFNVVFLLDEAFDDTYVWSIANVDLAFNLLFHFLCENVAYLFRIP